MHLFPIEKDDAWLTPDVRLVANSLRNAQVRSFAFPNYITTADVTRLVTGQGWQRNLGMAAYLSYIFPRRAPSETLQHTAAIPDDKLLKSPHMGQSRRYAIAPTAKR